MKIAWETLAAAVLVAASILFIGRYQISAIGYGETHNASDVEVVYRLDRWTGKIDLCPKDNSKADSTQIECPAIDPAVQKSN